MYALVYKLEDGTKNTYRTLISRNTTKDFIHIRVCQIAVFWVIRAGVFFFLILCKYHIDSIMRE